MGARIYIGNLSYSTTEDALREAFEKHGNVESVSIITDRETGRPRGFAFVEMSTSDEAQAAIQALDGTSLDGRPLRVNEAQAKSRNGGGGGGGRGGPRGGSRW